MYGALQPATQMNLRFETTGTPALHSTHTICSLLSSRQMARMLLPLRLLFAISRWRWSCGRVWRRCFQCRRMAAKLPRTQQHRRHSHQMKWATEKTTLAILCCLFFSLFFSISSSVHLLHPGHVHIAHDLASQRFDTACTSGSMSSSCRRGPHHILRIHKNFLVSFLSFVRIVDVQPLTNAVLHRVEQRSSSRVWIVHRDGACILGQHHRQLFSSATNILFTYSPHNRYVKAPYYFRFLLLGGFTPGHPHHNAGNLSSPRVSCLLLAFSSPSTPLPTPPLFPLRRPFSPPINIPPLFLLLLLLPAISPENHGVNMARPFISPFSPIKPAQAAMSGRTALGNVGNANIGQRKTFKGKAVTTYLPSTPGQAGFSNYSNSPSKGDESLLSLGDMCDDLNMTPTKGNTSLNMSTTVYGFNAALSPLNEHDESTYGFNDTSFGFGGADLSLCYPERGSIPTNGVEQTRTANAQAAIAEVRMVNEQIRATDAGTMPANAVPFARAATNQANVANVRMVNEQVRGANAGEKTEFDMSSKQLSTEANSQRRVADYSRVNEQARGANPGKQHYYSTDSKQLSGEAKAQVIVADYARVNQQVTVGMTAGTIPADSVDNVRTRDASDNMWNVRAVNEQVRGELAGEKTLFDLSSKQLSAEGAAQADVAKYVRVSEQARGELAGMPTAYDLQAREMMRHQHQQAEVRSYGIVNEQVKAVGPGTIPADSEENVRAKHVSGNMWNVRQVNEQVRGELSGLPTYYNTDSAQMSTEGAAQKRFNKASRVNQQARGEFAGAKTLVDSSSERMVAAAAAPKIALVNQQILHVGRGKFTHDAAVYRHVNKFNKEQTDTKAQSQKHRGVSAHGAGAMRFKTVAAAPKPQTAASTIRGEFAGKKTGYGMSSMSYQNSVNAPKTSLVNQQVRFGAKKHVAAADASAFATAREWVPESHMIIAAQTDEIGASPVKEVAPQPSPVKEDQANSVTANFFGLKKSKRRTKPATVEWTPNYSGFSDAVKSFR